MVPADKVIFDRLRHELSTRPEIELGLVFGSRARGGAAPTSDLDLAVMGRAVDPIALGAALSSVAGCEVDVVDAARAGFPLLSAIVRDGVVVWGTPGAAGRFYSHAIASLETDRPWFARMRDGFLRRLAEKAPARG